MITVEFKDENSLIAVEDATAVNWQIKSMKNTKTDRYIINGMKSAYREYKVDFDMNVLERRSTYPSVSDATQNKNIEKEWVETDLSFRADMIGYHEDYEYKLHIYCKNGTIEDVELVEKRRLDD